MRAAAAGVGLFTAQDIADVYGVSARRVRAIALHRNIRPVAIWRRAFVYHESDVDRFRPGRKGRPRGSRREAIVG